MSAKDELVIPDAAGRDARSFELLRVWIAEKSQHVSLRNAWQDPAAWGIMLADLAKHVANAYQQEAGLDAKETLRRITNALHVELKTATAEPTGKLDA